MTQGADNKVGTSADETFNGFVDNGVTSFQYNLDTIDGGTGVDTLVAYGQDVGAASAVSMANVTNVEKLHMRATGASNFDASSTVITELKNDGSSAALTFSNINSTTPKLVVQGSTAATNFGFKSSVVAGGTDAVSVLVNGVGGANALTVTAGIETVNLEATGADSSIVLSNTGGAGNALTATALNIVGSGKLTLGDELDNVKTLTADTATGALTIDLTSNSVATGTTVKTGSANDKVTVTGTTLSKATGAADSINLGGGTGDVLAVAGDLSAVDYATFLAAANSVVTNTEGVQFNSKTVNETDDAAVVDVAGYTNGTVNFIFNTANDHATTASASGKATVAITTAVTANSFTFNENTTGNGETTTGDIAVSITGASAGQTANIVLGGAVIKGGVGAAATADGGAAFNLGSGISSVVLTSNSDTANNTNAITGGSTVNGNTGNDSYAFVSTNLATFTLKGATNITIEGGSGDTGGSFGKAGFSTGVNFSATDYTGAATLYLAADATTGDIFAGGSGADRVWGLAGNDSLSGALGNDSLNGGAGQDTLVGGDGDDVLLSDAYPTATGAAAAEILTGGAGTDKFYVAHANATSTTEANVGVNTLVITDLNATGEKIYLSSKAGVSPTAGQELLGNTALADKAWNAATGIVATDNQVINLGSLATVTGKTTVAGDLSDIFVATTAAAGKIASANGSEFVLVFNSARDGATYAAVINDATTAGFAFADDSMTLIKLTGVAVADLSASDFALYATDPF